jgi:hypothetical protein
VARMESADGYAIAPFVVRSSSNVGKTVVNYGALTVAAYNKFGGASAYRGLDNTATNKSRVVSFDRPIDGTWALNHFMRQEVTVAIAVDRNLSDAAWTTGVDMHSGATSLAGVTSFVTSGHDEYWSVPSEKSWIKPWRKARIFLRQVQTQFIGECACSLLKLGKTARWLSIKISCLTQFRILQKPLFAGDMGQKQIRKARTQQRFITTGMTTAMKNHKIGLLLIQLGGVTTTPELWLAREFLG